MSKTKVTATVSGQDESGIMTAIAEEINHSPEFGNAPAAKPKATATLTPFVNILQENLAHGLAIVGRAVAPHSTMPVLGNVLLTTENGRLKLVATNLDISIAYWAPAKIEAECAITLPARHLVDYVNALPPDRVEIALNARTATAHLKCARMEANLKGVDASEYPAIRTMTDRWSSVQIDPEALKEAVAQTVIAAATDDARPILTGVRVHLDKSQMTLAAVDGFRISVRTVPITGGRAKPFEVIVPARALSEAVRLIGDSEDPVTMAVDPEKTHALFRTPTAELVTTLVEGNFPDVNAIFPKSWATRTTLNTADLVNAVKSARVFSRESSGIVRLDIQGADGQRMIIASSSAESGDATAELDATVAGEAQLIALNTVYLLEVLGVLGSPQVVIETTSASSPAVIRPAGREDFTHVIVPMDIKR